MDMVERVEAALIAKAKDQTGGFDDYPASGLDYAALARAAVEAMREPTEMMCEAGNDTGAVENGVFRISNRDIATVYRAMIDAALKN